jgi:hypothetical protein
MARSVSPIGGGRVYYVFCGECPSANEGATKEAKHDIHGYTYIIKHKYTEKAKNIRGLYQQR